MDIFDLISDRRTIQKYVNQEVPREVIEKSVLAAIQAPNHKLTYPWRFYLVTGSPREALAELNVRLKGEKRTLSAIEEKAIRAKFMEAGALLVVAQVKSTDPIQHLEDFASVACGIQNMSLWLWSEGYGSKWGSGQIVRHPDTYRILSIDPNVIEICGFIWIGKYSSKPAKPARPLVEDVFKVIS